MSFERENRYVVFKRTDLQKYVPPWLANFLLDISYHITEGRLKDGKQPFEAAVIEADWPEYETVWDMIQGRVEGEQAERTVQKSPTLGMPYGSKDGNACHGFGYDDPYQALAFAIFGRIDEQEA